MKMPQPVEDYYIVKMDEIKEEKTGGIMLPEEMKERPLTGTVLAAGKGKQAPENAQWIEQQAKKGDRVLFKRHGNTIAPIKTEGLEGCLIMRQSDILLIL